MDDNDNLVEYYKNNRYRKLNNTDEKSDEETINNYGLSKAELEKQLGETLNDLNLYIIFFFQKEQMILRNNKIKK